LFILGCLKIATNVFSLAVRWGNRSTNFQTTTKFNKMQKL
jgi:hypothetical protein